MPHRDCLGVFHDAGLADLDGFLELVRRMKRPYAVRLARVEPGPPQEDPMVLRCDNNVVLLGRLDTRMQPVVEGSLARVISHRPLMRFLFVWTGDVVATRAVLDATMAAVWRLGHLNVLALSASPRGSGEHELFSFNPFWPERCNDTTALLVATWTVQSGINFARNISDLFPFGGVQELVHLKMGGCPFRVAIANGSNFLTATFVNQSWHLSGVGEKILKACASTLRFRTELFKPNYVNRTLRYWEEYEAALGLSDMALFAGMRYQKGQIAGYHAYWCVTFAVPLGSEGAQPAYYMLTGPFHRSVWAAIAVAVLMAAVAARLLVVASGAGEAPVLRTTRGLLHLVLSPLVERPLHAVAMPRTSALRVFISSWMYLGLVLSTAYTSALRSLVLAPPYARTLWSTTELAEADITVLSNRIGQELLRLAGETDPRMRRVLQRSRIGAPNEFARQVANPTKVIVARRDWMLAEQRAAIGRAASLNDLLNGPGRLYIYPDYCLSPHHAYPFLLPPNSPHVLALRRVLRALAESGLALHWLEKDKWTPPPMFTKYLDTRSRREVPIKFNQVQPVFIMYSYCLAVIAVLFTGELFVASLWRREPAAASLPRALAQPAERGGRV
ncbi:uncharacterized protein LOC117638937 [Thrips palmi]|uniref:Uncharacterized protein LOC117638937 n=1 Tax=Thrips palmi TaxID=161013 RepID=A0A6P8ZGG4_THRPL|nr:uncharacterized protein LOC117638937 [Thrips palmi]